MGDTLTLKVARTWCEARDVLALELRAPGGGPLPAFTAGAHIEVHLPGGLIRHYSLCNDPAERDRYCIGVGLARDSRGGSRYMHDAVRAGQTLTASPPRNNFPLDEGDAPVMLIAGGIGITPILSMVRVLESRKRGWKLFYCARNRQRAAFYEELCALDRTRCHFHFDDEQEAQLFNIAAHLPAVPPEAHIYCCGPGPLMEAVKAATADRPDGHVHFEWFTAAAVDTATDRPFTVILRQSGTRFVVPVGKSILEVLEDNDAGVPYSCREGLCATCKTPVLAGIPDHRDSVLSDAERDANDQMMICVSRAKGEEIELDL